MNGEPQLFLTDRRPIKYLQQGKFQKIALKRGAEIEELITSVLSFGISLVVDQKWSNIGS